MKRLFSNIYVHMFLVFLVFILGINILSARNIDKMFRENPKEGHCLESNLFPAPRQMVIFKFDACPLGQMQVYGIKEVASIRQGLFDTRHKRITFGPDRQMASANPATHVIGLYTENNELEFLVKWIPDDTVYSIYTDNVAITADSSCYKDTDSIVCAVPDTDNFTACLGTDDGMSCLAVYNLKSYQWGPYIKVWAGWFKRP